jgi:hypothetical protein
MKITTKCEMMNGCLCILFNGETGTMSGIIDSAAGEMP